jgi:hypothetical protein
VDVLVTEEEKCFIALSPAVLFRVLKSGSLHLVPHHRYDIFHLKVANVLSVKTASGKMRERERERQSERQGQGRQTERDRDRQTDTEGEKSVGEKHTDRQTYK